MDGVRQRVAGALSIGGLAALCSAPSVTSSVGGVGSLLQAELQLLLPEEQQFHPQSDMLLMHFQRTRSSTMKTAGRRRASRQRSRSASEDGSRGWNRVASRNDSKSLVIEEPQFHPEPDMLMHLQRRSTCTKKAGQRRLLRRRSRRTRGTRSHLSRRGKASKSRVAGAGHRKERSRRRMRSKKTRCGSRKGSGSGSKFKRRHRRRRTKHRLRKRLKRVNGAQDIPIGDATGTLAMLPRANQSPMPPGDGESPDASLSNTSQAAGQGLGNMHLTTGSDPEGTVPVHLGDVESPSTAASQSPAKPKARCKTSHLHLFLEPKLAHKLHVDIALRFLRSNERTESERQAVSQEGIREAIHKQGKTGDPYWIKGSLWMLMPSPGVVVKFGGSIVIFVELVKAEQWEAACHTLLMALNELDEATQPPRDTSLDVNCITAVRVSNLLAAMSTLCVALRDHGSCFNHFLLAKDYDYVSIPDTPDFESMSERMRYLLSSFSSDLCDADGPEGKRWIDKLQDAKLFIPINSSETLKMAMKWFRRDRGKSTPHVQWKNWNIHREVVNHLIVLLSALEAAPKKKFTIGPDGCIIQTPSDLKSSFLQYINTLPRTA